MDELTANEWQVYDNPLWVGRVLRGRVSARKQRLHACAWYRQNCALYRLNDRCRRATEVLERYADGLATEGELAAARAAILDWRDLIERGEFECVAASRDIADHCAPALAGLSWGQPTLLRDLYGPLPFRRVEIDPAWLAWQGGTVRRLAEAIYADRTFESLPILADALEEAGCGEPTLLAHLRGPGPHIRGCWALDLVLGKE